jgi:hypothetical protein
MEDPRREIKEIRDTIQFAMVIVIFFSAFMYGAMKAVGVTEANAELESLIWGVGVALHIGNYFLVGLFGSLISESWMKWVRGSLIVGILAFIDPIIVGSVYSNAHLSAFPANLFLVFFFIAFAMPLVTCVLLILGAYWVMIKEIWGFIKGRWKSALKEIVAKISSH